MQTDAAGRFLENERTGYQYFGVDTRILLRVWCTLGNSDVTCGLNKLAKLNIRDRMFIHPEAIDVLVMHWLLLRIKIVGTHEERSSWDPNHVLALASKLPEVLGGVRMRAPRVLDRTVSMLRLALLLHCSINASSLNAPSLSKAC